MSNITGTVSYSSPATAQASRLSSAERFGTGGGNGYASASSPAPTKDPVSQTALDPANLIQGLLQASLSAATAVHLASIQSASSQPQGANAPKPDTSEPDQDKSESTPAQPEGGASTGTSASTPAQTSSTPEDSQELTEEEQKVVDDLKATDQEIKAHEQAHATVGGPYAGQPQYEYTTGPDGKRYAIGGEVPIDVSPIANNPDATIRKMDIVIRAALAPAEPSSQDKQVAQSARQIRLQAQIEKRELQEQSIEEDGAKSVFAVQQNEDPDAVSALKPPIEEQNSEENREQGNKTALAALRYATSQALTASLSGISGAFGNNGVNIVA